MKKIRKSYKECLLSEQCIYANTDTFVFRLKVKKVK